MLNVTKHFKWIFKTLRSVVICSIRQIRLIWSFSLSCKNSHLSKMTEMAAFFLWWKGQGEMHHVQSLWLFLKNSSVFPMCCDQKPSRGQRRGKWRRVTQDTEMSSASQGGCQSRHLDQEAIELVMTAVVPYQSAFCNTMSWFKKKETKKTNLQD